MLPWGGPAHLPMKYNQLFLYHLSVHPLSQIKLWDHPYYSKEELVHKVQNHKEPQTNSLWRTLFFFFPCIWLFFLYWMLKFMHSLDKDWGKVILNETWPQTGLKRDNVHGNVWEAVLWEVFYKSQEMKSLSAEYVQSYLYFEKKVRVIEHHFETTESNPHFM